MEVATANIEYGGKCYRLNVILFMFSNSLLSVA